MTIQQATIFGGADSDPYFANVMLLLHGDGDNGGTIFTDSSSYNRTPIITGSIITGTDINAFGGSSIQFGLAVANILYSASFAGATDDYTFEYWQQVTSSNCFNDGYAEGRGEFVSLRNSSFALVHSSNGPINGPDLTWTTPFATRVTDACGVTDYRDRVHVMIIRQGSSGTAQLFINGYFWNDGYQLNKTVDNIYIGPSNLGFQQGRYNAAKVEEVRFTKGILRIPFQTPTPASGTYIFDVPTAPYPNT